MGTVLMTLKKSIGWSSFDWNNNTGWYAALADTVCILKYSMELCTGNSIRNVLEWAWNDNMTLFNLFCEKIALNLNGVAGKDTVMPRDDMS
jgi:hypothetical protein